MADADSWPARSRPGKERIGVAGCAKRLRREGAVPERGDMALFLARQAYGKAPMRRERCECIARHLAARHGRRRQLDRRQGSARVRVQLQLHQAPTSGRERSARAAHPGSRSIVHLRSCTSHGEMQHVTYAVSSAVAPVVQVVQVASARIKSRARGAVYHRGMTHAAHGAFERQHRNYFPGTCEPRLNDEVGRSGNSHVSDRAASASVPAAACRAGCRPAA